MSKLRLFLIYSCLSRSAKRLSGFFLAVQHFTLFTIPAMWCSVTTEPFCFYIANYKNHLSNGFLLRVYWNCLHPACFSRLFPFFLPDYSSYLQPLQPLLFPINATTFRLKVYWWLAVLLSLWSSTFSATEFKLMFVGYGDYFKHFKFALVLHGQAMLFYPVYSGVSA